MNLTSVQTTEEAHALFAADCMKSLAAMFQMLGIVITHWT